MAAALASLRILRADPERPQRLRANTTLLVDALTERGVCSNPVESAIVTIPLKRNDDVSTVIIFRDLLPNVVPPVASYAMTITAVLIIAEASLSFLGLGIRAPKPSWGGMIAEGQGGVIENHPHIVVVPGVVLFLTVAAFNVVGEKAKRRFALQRTEV